MRSSVVVALMIMTSSILFSACGAMEDPSKMVADIVAWHKPRVSRSAEQWALVNFVDNTGGWMRQVVLGERDSDLALLKANVYELSLREKLNWYDALTYANSLKQTVSLDDLVEIHRRVCGGEDASSGLRPDPSLRQEVESFLEKLNAGIRSASKGSLKKRVVASSKLAAWSVLTLRELEPFVDGNDKVMEMIISVIMRVTGVTVFPFRLHSNSGIWSGAYTDMPSRMVKGGGELSIEEMTDYVILQLWDVWRLNSSEQVSTFFSAVKDLVYPF